VIIFKIMIDSWNSHDKVRVKGVRHEAAHAEKMFVEHERKLKRQQKLVQKWRQKVRYYERALEKRAAKEKR